MEDSQDHRSPRLSQDPPRHCFCTTLVSETVSAQELAQVLVPVMVPVMVL